MTQLLKHLNISTKFLDSDELKEIIYKNTGYTGDTKCVMKKEVVKSLSDTSGGEYIYNKMSETNDAYDTYFEEGIKVDKDLGKLVISSYMVWDNYNIDARSVKYIVDIE